MNAAGFLACLFLVVLLTENGQLNIQVRWCDGSVTSLQDTGDKNK